MPTLIDLIGKEILIRCLFIEEKHPVFVQLVSVEQGGIWVESQELTNKLFEGLGVQMSANSPVFFVPYAKIEWINHFVSGRAALSEKSFGVK